VMGLRLGLQLASVATTMGAGYPFVPSNLDFIDWENRGAEFVAVNGRSAEKIRQDYHALFETGLLDPFKNGSCLFFAGVTFNTCFIPAVARNFDEPVGNAGFAGGNHYPDGLQGTGSAYINTEIGFLAAQRNNHSAMAYGSKIATIAGELLGNGGGTADGPVWILRTPSPSIHAYSANASFVQLPNLKGIHLVNRADSAEFLHMNADTTDTKEAESDPIGTSNVAMFARNINGIRPTDSRLTAAAFGDAHPHPTDLRTALNDLFINKMGITI
jgi:hypothetical protein